VILLGEGSNPEIDTGKIQSFLGAKFASDEDAAPDVCPSTLTTSKLDETVVQGADPRFDRPRQPGKLDRDTPASPAMLSVVKVKTRQSSV
jgi:hypothetical protein